ncbi:4-hydroxybenzoate octaprenyltransferase [Xinfangfangia sp. D13-10-4-6]|uniref:4-hydroxybenzoate octaprenyltransferase n=1 Tax=Pseudogemmobacter hezensis TaxID=2737662 RepID=UPI001555C19B|nr:4-hydroxybenzoate octaprenyltransferase [Pseudogemmobacter hezensis]
MAEDLADQLQATASKIKGAQGPGSVADAPKDNWVDLYAPQALRPWLRLSRADRPIGTWLLWIPCLWAIALAANSGAGFSGFDLWLVVSSGIGAFLMRGAGCTWNDITDRHIDGAVERTRSRPLPSGQVTVKGALVWMVAQMLIAALILLSYNWLSVGLGIASLALVAIYPFAKRFTWWPQVFLGLAFNWGAVLLWAAHSGSLAPAAGVLWLSGIVWTLFYDTIYAHQDKEDDALIGVKSTARLFGDNSGKWLAGFLGASVVLMALAVILAIPASRGVMPMLLALLGVWAFGLHMLWQMKRLDINDPAICLRLFRSNRDAGLIPVLFLAASAFL